MASKCKRYAKLIHSNASLMSIVDELNKEFQVMLTKVKQQPVPKRYTVPDDAVLEKIFMSRSMSIVWACLSKIDNATKVINDDNNRFIHLLLQSLTGTQCMSQLSLSNSTVNNYNSLFDDITQEILEDYVQKSICYGLTTDETDGGDVSIIGLYARFALREGKMWQHKISMKEFLKDCSGENLFKWLLYILKEHKMNVLLCTSITTDGASSMIGNKKGLATRLVEYINERRPTEMKLYMIVSVYCFSHKENLNVVYFMKNKNIKLHFRIFKWLSLSTTCKRWRMYASENNLN